MMEIYNKFRDFVDFILSFLPKQRKVVFVNFYGRGFGDNPKYIAEEILKEKLGYDLVWLVADMNELFPTGIRKVKFFSLKCKYELSTAKIIVSNTKRRLPYRKSESQYYIQTWHGGFPLKYIEKEAERDLPESYLNETKKDSQLIDLLISGSEFQTKILKESFWYQGEIFTKGIPRNDILINHSQLFVKQAKREYGILDDNCKIVIYAPTFRDDFNISAYCLNVHMLLDALNRKTGFKWKIIIRLHPNVAYQNSLFEYNENVIDGSGFSDPQELLVISDLLITDYSSVMMDFGIMKRPVILFAADLKEYVVNCRNLRSIFYNLPFPLSMSNEGLVNIIQTFDINEYTNILNAFLDRYYKSYDDGKASKSVVERIKQVMEA